MADIPDRSPAAGSFDAAREARSRSDERMPAVPLPDGGNLNGIRWEEGGGTVHPAELEGVLEYNAACQWLRASRDGREADVARRILADVPAWPALRGTDSGAVWNQVVRELGRGGEVSAGVLADCDASHEREVAYAAERGRIPST
jgi:hypothetical protein